MRKVIDGFLRSGGSDVIGHGLFLIDAEELGVGANESFVEDAAGEEIEFLILERFEHPCADFGGSRNLVERDTA